MTQSSGAGTTRRHLWFAVITAGLAFASAIVVAACELPSHANAFSTVDEATSCPSGQTLCAVDGGATVCTDVATDPANCSACGASCGPTFECSSGACACPAGQMVCGGVGGICVDITQDSDNCGGCGVGCGVNGLCDNAACVLACPPDSTNCTTECADLKTSVAHCSSCETSCGVSQLCQDGFCITCPVANQCPNPDGGAELCVDLDSYANCGHCGASCAYLQACQAGSCTCNAPDYMCPLLVGTPTTPKGTLVCRGSINNRCGSSCTDCTVSPNKNAVLLGCVDGKCIIDATGDASATAAQ